MSIFTNRIIQEAYKNVYRNRLLESRQFIYENALDNKVNELAKKIAIDLVGQDKYGKEPVLDEQGRPEIYQTSGKPKVYDRVYIKHKVGLLINNSKKLDGKFFLGSLRIFRDLLKQFNINSEELRRECSEFNKILGIICDDIHHQQEYDNNLNGKSLDEFKELFGQTVKDVSDKRKEALNSKNYNKNERYTIIPCNEWEDLLPYGSPLTTWCVAQSDGKDAYNSYTNNGMNKFYICLRDDYKTVATKVGPNAPLDDYGLSMIAINVREDGELNTCTVRWNYDHGGNDHTMTVEQISDLLGVNFYETFKPRDPKEAFEKMYYNIKDPICAKLGFRKDSNTFYYNIEDNKLIKYKKCYIGNSLACLANTHFFWFDFKSGNKTEPPERIEGKFDCCFCDSLTSLEGSPREVDGIFNCFSCKNLTSLKGAPNYVSKEFICYNCENLTSLEGAPREVGGDFNCDGCKKLTTLEGAPRYVGGGFICCSCHNLTSLDGSLKKVGGDFSCADCYNLVSLEGCPKKVGGDFNCAGCSNLISLKGAPRKVGGEFSCFGCRKLVSLVGSPRYVGRDFHCDDCVNLITFKGSPRKVGGDFYFGYCVSLESYDGITRNIGGKYYR